MSNILCIIPYYDFYGNPHLVSNHRRGVESLQKQGVDTVTLEAVYKETPRLNQKEATYLNVDFPLWYKENLINIGMQNFRNQYEYIAWVDSGILLENGWVDLAIEELKSVDLVQCFSAGNWLNQNGVIEDFTHGQIYSIQEKVVNPKRPSPGGAWMARSVTCVDNFLYDKNIVGGGDSLLTSLDLRQPPETSMYTRSHAEDIHRWYELHKKRQLSCSYINSTFTHLWHATMESRHHASRHNILKDNDYNPGIDITYSSTGILTYSVDNTRLHSSVTDYLLNRLGDNRIVSQPEPKEQVIKEPKKGITYCMGGKIYSKGGMRN